jgi:hypothetical protein
MEVYGAAPNRMKMKRRKAWEPLGELAFGSEAQYPLGGLAYWRRSRCEVLRTYPERPLGLRGEESRAEFIENERTR